MDHKLPVTCNLVKTTKKRKNNDNDNVELDIPELGRESSDSTFH